MHSLIYLIGQALIGLFFIATGVFNILKRNQQLAKLKNTIIPKPIYALSIAIMLQIVGGVLLTINVAPVLGACMTLIFTLLATIFFMRFWQEASSEVREIKFLFFVEHCAVIGALLMIIFG
ncbi:MAG: DoxX family membrane protein [Coxiellaceae bacterium]|nr:DoxX family membrane protein [Coxiellaceae bacterium]